MTDLDKCSLYLLSRCEGIGPIKAAKLLAHFSSPSDLMHTSSKELREKLVQFIPQIELFFRSDWREKRLAERDLLLSSGIQMLYKGNPDYPPNLLHISDAPLVLYASGQSLSAEKKLLSVVGTRAMTAYGKKVVEQLLMGLDANQLIIVSGLAKGVDAYVQSMATEMRFEVASVVAHGLDTTYPRGHFSLRRKIEKHGCTFSEFFNGVKPLAGHFVARNRIIAGLSEATLIVESAQSGGSLTTADFAFGYQRLLIAVPGRVSDGYSLGCNRLIGESKAQLYVGPETLIEALQLKQTLRQKLAVSKIQFKNKNDIKLYEYLVKNGRVYPSQLLRQANMKKEEIYTALFSLTLDGIIVHHNDNSYEIL